MSCVDKKDAATQTPPQLRRGASEANRADRSGIIGLHESQLYRWFAGRMQEALSKIMRKLLQE